MLSAKQGDITSSTIFLSLMTQPGIEPHSPGTLANINHYATGPVIRFEFLFNGISTFVGYLNARAILVEG